MWQFWIDRGGTFTDVVGLDSDARLVVHKLLSENPGRYSDAATQGIREILGVSSGEPLPSEMISEVRMGTTIATNALLERKGAPTVFVTNRGFRDALKIGYQNRPNIFALNIIRPEPLYSETVEFSSRMDADGRVITPFDETEVRAALEEVFHSGIKCCAIAFMHSYLNPEHEIRCAEIAHAVGFEQVSVSHDVSPLIKFVSRGDTTVADAYLSPVLKRYLDKLSAELGDTKISFMQSNGGLADKALFRGKDSLLSGPAGGVVGCVKVAEALGYTKLIGFDMGGTSTDVFHYDGEFERHMDTEVAGVKIRAPMLSIHTVAAGGGSIVSFKNGRFQVGPESAGAYPGPACYRNGGPLTITDCNVYLGRIRPDHFPHVFGPDGSQPIDPAIVATKLSQLSKLSKPSSSFGVSEAVGEVANGFLAIAVEKMAQAIKKISIDKGYDISDHALVSFGGAGGQHACMLAESLGMKTVIIHPLAGVLSAVGIGLADTAALKQHHVQRTVSSEALNVVLATLTLAKAEAAEVLVEQGVPASEIVFETQLLLRYADSDFSFFVTFEPQQDANSLLENFHKLHHVRYGFSFPEKDVIIESVLVRAKSSDAISLPQSAESLPMDEGQLLEFSSMGKLRTARGFSTRPSEVGSILKGPALIYEKIATTVVEEGWQCESVAGGALILRQCADRVDRSAPSSGVAINEPIACDSMILELFNNKFMAIAEQMGLTLQNTSHSVNIKERLDFSCAVFDSDGSLIANAPHIPVHLGSMGETVKTILKNRADSMKPGDVYILNDPYNGGTHLPDVTAITPVFDNAGKDLLFFTASRGHHADIGGITPGSMPPTSKSIEEEGVLINDFMLVSGGEFRESKLIELLSSGAFPVRNVQQNISDLKAQVAANVCGAEQLSALAELYGVEFVKAYMGFIRDNAEQAIRDALTRLKDGKFSYPMDDGSCISVTIKIDHQKRTALIDFAGTSPQRESNFNAPTSVCRAAVLYVFRTLINDSIPLNDGCFAPLEIRIPSGSMLNPTYPAAVVAGNVETSQAICDALYGALGVLSGSQGTMNNFTFGDETLQYYETICGGSGAGPDFNGADTMQTHMTNSRLTDPEVLESRFPVLVENFSIREESGGDGLFRGGNGVIRRIKFLKPMSASILSNNRSNRPFGTNGGESGKSGCNYVIRASGVTEQLTSCAQITVEADDSIVLETPGGGGFGK